jgi:hypothetical protein
MQWDVMVIGGGASGLMAAGRAAECGATVLLLEKNKTLGKKLAITGGGRCNITNAEFSIRELLKHYGKAEQFLYSLFSQFGVQDTFDFFKTLGLPLEVEAHKRAFPASQKAPDVVRVLKKYIKAGNVVVKTDTTATSLKARDKRIIEVATTNGNYAAGAVIIATGGSSHPETGSSGDGFVWLAELGHTVRPPNPSLVPLKVKDAWVKKLAGTSLPLKITFFQNGKKTFSKTGSVLFTHFGLSGPSILNSAYEIAELLEKGSVTAELDFYPNTDAGTLEKNLLKAIDENKNKKIANALDLVVPRGVAKAITLLALPRPEIKAHSLTKENRKYLVSLLKNLPLSVAGLMGLDRAIVSDGGVQLSEINTKTMRSHLYENLYCTGDTLNINRPSGGYSLQLCWSTGWVAGTAAADSFKKIPRASEN